VPDDFGHRAEQVFEPLRGSNRPRTESATAIIQPGTGSARAEEGQVYSFRDNVEDPEILAQDIARFRTPQSTLDCVEVRPKKDRKQRVPQALVHGRVNVTTLKHARRLDCRIGRVGASERGVDDIETLLLEVAPDLCHGLPIDRDPAKDLFVRTTRPWPIRFTCSSPGLGMHSIIRPPIRASQTLTTCPACGAQRQEIDVFGYAADIGIVVVGDHADPHGAGSTRKIPGVEDPGVWCEH